ncbi:MAG: alpha/beta hydrolase [Mycobacterium sp.]|uniref:alpha/beta fold hydrolase n=1 Tax=Mycobacterium sp. TaxID=1785 RepID=UPI001EC8EB93|nr:alpha/beta hydrolase [Mycobacterium sp.]MBV8785121.1 alpha/beta hydrolase [Mycobacterium sp.]
MTAFSNPVDGFRLAFDRFGSPERPSIVLLHGWPGDRWDHRAVVARLTDVGDIVVPDLRGFGESDKHLGDPNKCYSAQAQARSVVGLLDQLGLDRVVLGGYDIGSRIAQTLARMHPQRISAMVLSPPLPGIGDRILEPEAQKQFWYQTFHQLTLADDLIDGNPGAVRAYLRHFWNHWSGPQFTIADDDLDRLAEGYESPGSFTASIGWYRAGAGSVALSLSERVPDPTQRIGIPTQVLWPDRDPVFPRRWADRLDSFFSDITVHSCQNAGHLTPVECASEFADLVRGCL